MRRKPSMSDPQPHQAPDKRPSIPLAAAILVTTFCCLPLGLVAVVLVTRALCRADGGDYRAASEMARKADLWINAAAGAGIVMIVVYLALRAAA